MIICRVLKTVFLWEIACPDVHGGNLMSDSDLSQVADLADLADVDCRSGESYILLQ